MAHMSRSEGNHKDPGRQTQVVIFSGKCVDLLGQLSVPPPLIPLCMGVRVRVQAEGQLWVSLGMTWLGCLDGESRVSLASAFLPLGLQVYLQS